MSALQYLIISVMKKPYLFLILLLSLSLTSMAQDVIRVQTCSNYMNSNQDDSLKILYGNDWYIILK